MTVGLFMPTVFLYAVISVGFTDGFHYTKKGLSFKTVL